MIHEHATLWICRYAGSLETSYDNEELLPDWEIDPATLEIGAKVGQGEFGAVHKVNMQIQAT